MRYVWLIFLGLILGCSPEKEQAPPPKKTGLRLAKAKREPKDLAQEFQQTLADNDAEDMMSSSWLLITEGREVGHTHPTANGSSNGPGESHADGDLGETEDKRPKSLDDEPKTN